jgi:hypothetical protein
MNDDHTQYLMEGLDHDRQLKNNPKLKEGIRRVLAGNLQANQNPFRGGPVHDPEPKPAWVEKLEAPETPVDKIRKRNRYIK